MKNSISIRQLGKCYKLYASRNDRLKDWLLPFSGKRYTEKWVLQDINLEVQPGEAVGIIGMNGAGKSTLLKIITGTTVPTTGSVEFHGSVSALLELGLGFHPDFTGRQNVYMSGQLLGYTNEEIDACMQQIEDFAEIGTAVDEPVRTYSSGMQVRLAFSVATMKRPDILIVDEALSVGDSYFQHKSFQRIKKFCDDGTTLLLVSHDANAIQAVCDRAVLLDHGKILHIGEPEEIMNYYNAMLGDSDGETIKQERMEDGHVRTVSGNGYAKITDLHIFNSKGVDAELVDVGENVSVTVDACIEHDIPELACGFQIKNRLGEAVYGINTGYEKKLLYDLKKGETVKYTFRFPMNLGTGNYSISFALHSGKNHIDNNYEWRDLALVYEVVNQSKPTFAGGAYLGAEVDIQRGE